MSAELDELLGELRQAGRRDSGGGFTLDWRKAREKLRRFQLLDPHRWVAHAVAAGVANGATRIEVTTDSDDCILRFDGPFFGTVELENLFAYLLSEQPEQDPTGRLRELAIALNAAAALNPARVMLRSGSTLLELKGLELSVSGLPRPSERNELHLRERVSWKVLRRFVTGQAPEAQVLKERCGLAPVVLNGKELFEPVHMKALATVQAGEAVPIVPASVHLSLPPEGCRGAVLGLLPHALEGCKQSGRVRFLRHGVLVCEEDVDLGPTWVQAVLDAPDLSVNVSHSGVVEDEKLRHLLIWLRSLVRLALTRLAGTSPLEEEAAAVLRHAIGNEIKAADYSDAWRTYRQSLVAAALWENQAGQPVDLRAALQAFEKEKCLWVTTGTWKEAPLDGQPVLRLTERSSPHLARIFKVLKDAGELLQEAHQAALNRRCWEEGRPVPVRLGHGLYLARLPLERGELVFHGDPTLPPALLFFKAGRPLGLDTEVQLPRGLSIAWDDDRLTPNRRWTGVEHDEAWSAACQEIARGIEPALVVLSQVDQSLARPHLQNLLRWRLERQDAAPLVDELERFPLFTALDGSHPSLAELREREKVRYLEQAPPSDLSKPVRDALLVSADEWSWLVHFLGEDRLVDASPDLEPLLREKVYLEREVVTDPLPGGLVRHEFAHGVLVLERTHGVTPRFEVEALYKDRLLERILLEPPPFGTVRGRVDIAEVGAPNAYYDQVGRGRARLCHDLQLELRELALKLARMEPDSPGLLDYFCSLLPGYQELGRARTPWVRSVCQLPLLSGGLSLDRLLVLIAQDATPDLPQREKIPLRKLFPRHKLERGSSSRSVTLPELSEGLCEAVYELSSPWEGKLGLTREKKSWIVLPGTEPILKRSAIPFQAVLSEPGQGKDWQRELVELACKLGLARAAESPEYLFFLAQRCSQSHREFESELHQVEVRGDVLGRPYKLGDLLAGPVEYLAPGMRAPAAHPAGPLYRLRPEQVQSWGSVLAMVAYRPPATRLDLLWPGRAWFVRLPLEAPLDGELGVPLEGEAGEVRVLASDGAWLAHPLRDHRGVLGVVVGQVPDLEALLPLEPLERELALLYPRLAPEHQRLAAERILNWRDWKGSVLGLLGSPLRELALFAEPEEGTSGLSEVEEPPMAEPVAQNAPTNPRERLAGTLRSQMRAILGDDPELVKAIPQIISFGPTPKGTFCACTPDGRVTLNPAHSLVEHLLNNATPRPEYLFFLVSAVFSVINRARADIQDHHEREFHARLLAYLLEE